MQRLIETCKNVTHINLEEENALNDGSMIAFSYNQKSLICCVAVPLVNMNYFSKKDDISANSFV